MTDDEKATPLESITVRLQELATLCAYLRRTGRTNCVEQSKAHALDKIAEILNIKINA